MAVKQAHLFKGVEKEVFAYNLSDSATHGAGDYRACGQNIRVTPRSDRHHRRRRMLSIDRLLSWPTAKGQPARRHERRGVRGRRAGRDEFPRRWTSPRGTQCSAARTTRAARTHRPFVVDQTALAGKIGTASGRAVPRREKRRRRQLPPQHVQRTTHQQASTPITSATTEPGAAPLNSSNSTSATPEAPSAHRQYRRLLHPGDYRATSTHADEHFYTRLKVGRTARDAAALGDVDDTGHQLAGPYLRADLLLFSSCSSFGA